MNTQLIDFAKKLIEIESDANHPAELKQVLEIAKQHLKGFSLEMFEQNSKPSFLAYIGTRRPEKFKVLLNAHLDVVPGNPEQFKPYEKDGKLYGRGAYDMKAAGAVLMILFKELASKISYPLGLQIVTDEEIGGANGTEYQLQQGVYTDFIIAGENTNFRIKNEAKGILWFKIAAKGKTGHGAYPWEGDNALWKVIQVVETLKNELSVPTQPEWKTTVNLAKIETANVTFNKIPEDATAWVDVRFIPAENENIHEKIRKLIPQEFSIEFVQDQPAAFTEENNPFVQKLLHIIEKQTGEKSEIFQGHGAADVRFYTNTGSAGVEFGLIGGNHHADNEWIDIQNLDTYYTVMKEFLLSLS